MPKTRTLDQSFWDDPDTANLTRDERLLLIGMMTLCADDEGRLLADPGYLRKRVFGYDEDLTRTDVAAMRDSIIHRCHNVKLYVVEGQAYIWFANWQTYQEIRYVVKSRLPAYPGDLPQPPERAAVAGVDCGKFPQIAENSPRVEKSRVELQRVELNPPTPQPEQLPDLDTAPTALVGAKPQPVPKATTRFDFPQLWGLIETQQGFRPAWDWGRETKAVKTLLTAHPSAQPADFARFLAYVGTVWPFSDEPTRQPTFSKGAEHFGAWFTGAQPTTATNGDSHATNRPPDRITSKLTGISARIHALGSPAPTEIDDPDYPDVPRLRALPTTG